jgi:acetyl-CoA carboxylase beta subunit
MTVQRWKHEISKDVETELSEIFSKCVYCSLTVDSTDINSNVKICIFAHEVKSDSEVFEELADHHSIQGQAKGSHFIQELLTVWS